MTEVEQGLREAIRLRLLNNNTLREMVIVDLVRATGGGFVVLACIRKEQWVCWLTSLDNPAELQSGVYGSEADCRALLQRRKRAGGAK